MILTCPECATSYFVDPASIPPDGRTVKCTSCGARWRAEPGGATAAPEPTDTPSPAPAPEPETVAFDDLDVVAVEAEPGRPSPSRAKPSTPEKPKRRLGLIFGIVAALMVVLGGLGGAVMFRTQVAGMFPATAPIFAAVGLPVRETGLVLEGVASKPAFQAGRTVLTISGAIRNTKDEAATAPPIRFALVDAEGVELASLTAEPSGESLPGGAVRHFSVTMPDPPAGAHELVAAFDLSGAPAHE